MTEEKSKAKWYRPIAGVIVTIFLGAIGSGLWDVFLKDALISSYVMISTAIGSVSSGYLDQIHEDIGKANQNEASIALFLFLMISIVFLNILGARFVVRVFRHTSANARIHKNFFLPSPSSMKVMVVTVILAAIFNVIAYSHQAFETLYRMRAITWTERAIEIVHPSLSDKEFLQLRAQYRSVASAKDFYALVHSLRVYATRTNTKLPKFSAIGEPPET